MVKDGESVVDIESNQSDCEKDPRNEPMTGGERVTNALASLGLTLGFKASEQVENSSDSNRNSVKTIDDECSDIDMESLIHHKPEGEKGGDMGFTGKTQSKEKQKGRNSKRAAKPPRPRKGPALTASDLRLVKEISELVMKKRARVERLKSLKRLRSPRALSSAAPATSSNVSRFAMIITVIFLIVIIFQGFGSTTGYIFGQSTPSSPSKPIIWLDTR